MGKRLTELHARILDAYNGRTGVGVEFDCPCGCGHPCFVPFRNPMDGSHPVLEGALWDRSGETVETLTLHPGILRSNGCGWHGFVTDGEAVECSTNREENHA